jgi:hypothetical protein
MADDGPWLNVPQAAVLEVTRDIELAVGLTAETTALLVIKANRLLARLIVIPLEADADTEQRGAALKKFHEARTAMPADSRYLEAEQRVGCRLVAGVRTKAKRTPRGRYESVDPVEYIAAKLQGVDAIDKKTRTVILFDVLINLYDYIEHLTGEPITPAEVAPFPAPSQMREHPSQGVERWECTGDPVPKLIEWARSSWGEDIQKLPNRLELLRLFRKQFGRASGINEKAMREVRRHLAPREARRGGAPMHRRSC